MADRLELAFRRRAPELLNLHPRWLVAVSGGADSIALLHLVTRWFGKQATERLVVAHLDHGLRRGSKTDRRFVERSARQLGLPVVSDRLEVTSLKRKDESPEEAARRVRRKFLLDAMKQTGAEGILTGHTLDDQAETIVMRLVRGAGPEALAGIQPIAEPFVRPLLQLERAALRDWLTRRDLDWREDPTNRELRFDRNRLRHAVLPILQQELNPQAARNVAAAAELLREDAAYLQSLADAWCDQHLRRNPDGELQLPRPELRQLDPVIARRVARKALQTAGIDPRRIARRHIEALLDLAHPPGSRRIDLPGKHQAISRSRTIRLK